MKDLKSLFLPYELAKIAKEKGFNEPCLMYFDYQKEMQYKHPLKDYPTKNEMFIDLVSAPLYQQIVDWFRTEKGIYIEIMRFNVRGRYFSARVKTDSQTEMIENYATYYEALHRAIEEAFKLI